MKKTKRVPITFKQLKKFFIEQNLSPAQCAKKLKCSIATIYRRLRIFGLSSFNTKEQVSADHGILATAHTATHPNISKKLKESSTKKQKADVVATHKKPSAIDKQAKRLIQKAQELRARLPQLIQEANQNKVKFPKDDDETYLL